jgi:CRP-like cAMP-binding protein
MAVPLRHLRLIRQLETIAPLTEEDRTAIASLSFRRRSFDADRDIVSEGSRPVECCVVLEGLVCRYKMVARGRKQIVSFHLPGDMPDLQSLLLEGMDHNLAALTKCEVAFIPHAEVQQLIRSSPGVAQAFAKHTLVDGSIFREWIANVGRRSALERIAHVLCECFVRMRALGLAHDEFFELHLTQSELGDATGLSNVHVNRTMQELRRRELVDVRGRVHRILNWELLQETADFRPGYLHLRPGYGP